MQQPQPPISPSRTWTQRSVLSALYQHEAGNLSQSAQLFDAMTRDDCVASALAVLCKGIIGLPKVYSGPDADFLRDALPALLPDSVLYHLMRDAVGMGVGFAQIHPDRTPEPWFPGFFSWDWYSRQWVVNVVNETVDVGEWIVFSPTGSRPWMEGAVRHISLPWIVRQDAFSDWAKWSESYSRGIKKVTYPEEADSDLVKRFVASAKLVGANPVVACPRDMNDKGFDLDVLWPPSGGSADGFEKLISKCETKIAIAILGQHLTTEATGSGGYGAASIHANVKADIIRFWAEALSSAVRPYLDRRLADLGKEGSFEYATGNDAGALLAMGQGLVSLASLGIVDMRAILAKLGVPVLVAPIVDPAVNPVADQGREA